MVKSKYTNKKIDFKNKGGTTYSCRASSLCTLARAHPTTLSSYALGVTLATQPHCEVPTRAFLVPTMCTRQLLPVLTQQHLLTPSWCLVCTPATPTVHTRQLLSMPLVIAWRLVAPHLVIAGVYSRHYQPTGVNA